MASRRKFIKQAAGISLTCSGVSLIATFGGCVSTRYVNFTKSGDQMVVDKFEFIKDNAVLLSNDALEAPVFLIKQDSDDFKAIYMLCTHKGCDVKPAGAVLICPCHGSEFSRSGQVLKGPAEMALHQFPVAVEEDNILVRINI